VRLATLRSFFSVLALGVPILLGFFLIGSPVRQLLDAAPSLARTEPKQGSTPVVLMIFDELSIASLLGPDAHIDAGRFPNAARLAATSTWYPNATTVADATHIAVPAIVTGLPLDPDRLALASSVPGSIFTLMAGQGPLRVLEFVTRLCPVELCEPGQAERRGMAQLAADTTVIAGHVLLPEVIRTRLPSIEGAWTDFVDVSGARRARSALERQEDFLAGIVRDDPHALYYLHSSLPHIPWNRLPSGERYDTLDPTKHPHGLNHERWHADSWYAVQGLQRYLLQLGYTDRVLGRALDALEEAGIFEQAMVIVTADHGVAFGAGDSRRVVSPGNSSSIAGVPLFVKLPGQQEAKISMRPAQVDDILPTLAEQLDLDVPWELSGESLLGPGTRREKDRAIFSSSQKRYVPLGNHWPQVLATSERLRAIAGSGDWNPLLRAQPPGAAAAFAAASLDAAANEPDDAPIGYELSWSPRASDLGPTYVMGRIPDSDSIEPIDLALVLDGEVAAYTRTLRLGRDHQFTAWLAERPSSDASIEVLALHADSSGVRRLARLGTSAPNLETELTLRPYLLRTGDGTDHAVLPDRFRGAVDVVSEVPAGIELRGWAVDVARRLAVDRIVVRSDDGLVALEPKRHARTALSELFDAHPPSGLGYSVVLPGHLAESAKTQGLRVYAVAASGEAGELTYSIDYPFHPRAQLGGTRERPVLTLGMRQIRVVPGALLGERYEATRDAKRWRTWGWSFDSYEHDQTDRLLLFVDGQPVPNLLQRREVELLAQERGEVYRWSGFLFTLPSEAVGDHSEVRLFAVSRSGVASELR
jgi:hypothetical protein